MTQGQIMMRLRGIEKDLDATRKLPRDAVHLNDARAELSDLIEGMLADDRRAANAHRMSELPYDGRGKI